MKRTIGVIAILLCLAFIVPSALANEVDARVTMGANLDDAQRAAIYKDFGIEQGSVTELKVTNEEERAYLEGLVPEGKIGSVALSCVYIKALDEGEGLKISTNNINWCTEEMYSNALMTAGITDARVMVSAPFPVSGTAALTGIYKAYEDITGTKLNELAKSLGAEELVLTGELAEYIGSEQAAQLINELKLILDKAKNMTDDEVRNEIKAIAKNINVSITDGQVEQILKLARAMQGLDVDELKQKLISFAKMAETANSASEKLSEFSRKVQGFFAKVGEFFSRIFG
ncbi:MAG: hypothetical protein BWY11_01949 [Firmicutes bacterium ADurb.Bin182]|nr:MAG: hypothetical protein BWY11_01949 [Firmicutes bacterium ADurb.Bin182]